MLYHRWQVHGGRETPAPFWVANQLDGSGESFYLMNARSDDLSRYLNGIAAAFTAARQFAADYTVLIQVVAFSRPQEQLPQYLSVIDKCGFQECFLSEHLDSADGRLWRNVPGRRWHAQKKREPRLQPRGRPPPHAEVSRISALVPQFYFFLNAIGLR